MPVEFMFIDWDARLKTNKDGMNTINAVLEANKGVVPIMQTWDEFVTVE